MPQLPHTPPPGQLPALAMLVELEASWENMRSHPAPVCKSGRVTQSLHAVQSAYAAFRDKLNAYNKRYTPSHTPELLLNTPERLARWCASMSAIYRAVEDRWSAAVPVHLLTKAYRCADRLGVRLQKPRLAHAEPPQTVNAAVAELQNVAVWCRGIGGLATSA